MDAQAIAAVTLGRCPRVRSPECCCTSGRTRIVSRLSSGCSEPRITSMGSGNGTDGFRDGGLRGGKSLRPVGHDGETEGLAGSLKRDTMRRLMAGSVVCASGRAGDAAIQRKDDVFFSSNSDVLRTSPGRRAGGAHSSSDEWKERYGRFRDGREEVLFFHQERRGNGAAYFPDDLVGRGGMREAAGKRGYLTSDDRLREPYRNHMSEDGHEGYQEKRAVRPAGGLERGGDVENGSPQHSTPRQSTLNIPRSELMKIEELMFSGDLREGDSGRQVLNLQRALFWLGHLRGLSLTGYFGPETTRALQEFHVSHGISSLGVWGYHSQQLLWKRLHPEASHRNLAGKNLEKSVTDQKHIPDHVVADTWRQVKREVVHASHALREWQSNAFTGLVASVSSVPHPKVAAGKLGVLLLSVVVLSSLSKCMKSCFGLGQVQPVRRRILSWRNKGNFKRLPRKATQEFFPVQHGPKKLGAVDSDCYYSQNHDQQEITKNKRTTDRLLLFEGQMVRGDYSNNAKSVTSSKHGDLSQTHKENVSRPTVMPKSPPLLLPESAHKPGSKLDMWRKSHGYEQSQKIEVDPPQEFTSYNLPFMQNGNPPKLTGGEQLWHGCNYSLHDVLHSGWAVWLSNFLARFLSKERRVCAHKGYSIRAILPSSSYRQTKPSHRSISGDLGLNLKSYERDVMVDNVAQNRQEEIQLDLKKRQGEELHITSESLPQTGVHADEQLHNLNFDKRYTRKKVGVPSLRDELQQLKDFNEALLISLQKKRIVSQVVGRAVRYQKRVSNDSGGKV